MRTVAPIAIAAVIAAGAVCYGVYYQNKRSAPPVNMTNRAVDPLRARSGTSERMRVPKKPEVHEPGLTLPIEGLKPSDIQDTYYQSRGGGERIHEATDILAPRGTPVHAMVDGVIQKLFVSKPGGNTIYEFDETGRLCYYYAHLDHYADGLHEGQRVRAGDVIGYVGTTGNADPKTPHLHLAFLRLNSEKQWWKGTPENPYPTLMRLVHENAD